MPTLCCTRSRARLLGSLLLTAVTALVVAAPARAGLVDCSTTWPGSAVLDDFSGTNVNPGLGANWRNTKSVSTDGGVFKRDGGLVRRDVGGSLMSNTWVGAGGTSSPQLFGGTGKRAWVAVKIAAGWNTTGSGYHAVTAWSSGLGGSTPSGYELLATQTKQLELRRWDAGVVTKLWGGPQTPAATAPSPNDAELLGNTDGIGMAIGDGCIRVYVSRAGGAYQLESPVIDNSYAGPFETGMRGQFLDNGPFNNPPNVKTAFDDFRAGDASTGTQPPLQTPTSAGTLRDTIGVNDKVGLSEGPYVDATTTKDKVQALGFRLVRTLVPKDQARRNYLASLPAGVKALVNAPRPSDYGNSLADEDGDGDTDLDDYLISIARSVDRIAGIGPANELDTSNRPADGSTLDARLTNLIAQTEALKAKRDAFVYPADPIAQAKVRALPIYSGPLGRTENWKRLQQLWTSGAYSGHLPQNYVDVADVHTYVWPASPSARLPYFASVAQTMYPGKPYVASETGYHNAEVAGNCTGSGLGVNETAGGIYTQRLPLEYAAAGFRGLYLHELVDQPYRAINTGVIPNTVYPYPSNLCAEAEFGLFRAVAPTGWGTIKPAGTAIQRLISQLGTYGSAASLVATRVGVRGVGVKHLLLQRSNGSYALALWQPADVYNATTDLDVSVGAASAQVTFPSSKSVTIRRLNPDAALPSPTSTSGTTITTSVPANEIVLVEFT